MCVFPARGKRGIPGNIFSWDGRTCNGKSMGQFSVADLPKNLEDQHSHQVCIQIIRSLNILNMILKKKCLVRVCTLNYSQLQNLLLYLQMTVEAVHRK